MTQRMTTKEASKNLLYEMGIRPPLAGYTYLLEFFSLVCEENQTVENAILEIAQRYEKRPAQVRQAMQYGINKACKDKGREQELLTRLQIASLPDSNRMLIHMVRYLQTHWAQKKFCGESKERWTVEWKPGTEKNKPL